MSGETTKTKKHSQLKNALLSCIADLVIITTQVALIIKRQIPFNIETYNPSTFYIGTILCILFFIASIIFAIYLTHFQIRTEKDDELSKLHRYRAGCISKYISVLIFAIVVFIVKDFSFAFTGDFIDGLSLPIIIIITSELISNITFIILEKFQLD